MKPLFNIGDIVYFKKEFRSLYTSGYYYHKLNQPYKVIDWNASLGLQTGTIQNLEDSQSPSDQGYGPRKWYGVNGDYFIKNIGNDCQTLYKMSVNLK